MKRELNYWSHVMPLWFKLIANNQDKADWKAFTDGSRMAIKLALEMDRNG